MPPLLRRKELSASLTPGLLPGPQQVHESHPAAQAVGQGRQVQKSVHLVREVGGVDDEDVTDDKRVAQAPLAQRRRPRPPDVGGNVGYQQWFEKAGYVFAGVTAHLQASKKRTT